MALDHAQLERLLCERLCANVRVHRRYDDVLMLESPFTFPDGDHYPIYLSETPGGGVKLSDRGHTLMHVSYEHDVDSFYEGARASLREQIVRESGIDEEEGIFSMEAPPDHVAAALFRFGQALTKIHDLTFLSRDRVASTFYDDLRGLLFTMLDEDNVDVDYIPPDVPNATAYPVDYHFPGSDGRPVFLYGVPGRDKARLVLPVPHKSRWAYNAAYHGSHCFLGLCYFRERCIGWQISPWPAPVAPILVKSGFGSHRGQIVTS